MKIGDRIQCITDLYEYRGHRDSIPEKGRIYTVFNLRSHAGVINEVAIAPAPDGQHDWWPTLYFAVCDTELTRDDP